MTLLSTGFVGPADEPNCGPSAVATLAGRSFDETMAAFRKLGPYGPRWKGRSYLCDRLKVLAHFEVPHRVEYQHQRGTPRHRLTSWAKRLQPGVTYMIDVTGHTFLYRDGLVLDQVQPQWTSVGKRRFRTRMVRSIVRAGA